jgi:hypothetical protein
MIKKTIKRKVKMEQIDVKAVSDAGIKLMMEGYT